MADNDTDGKTIAELFADWKGTERVLQRAVREALRRHKLLGESIVVWEDGKVVWLSADEIRIDDDPLE